MGKNQPQSDQAIKSKPDHSKKKKPGRPSNVQIQTQFMNIIRDTKLQAINAETQLELQMAFFTTQDEKKSRRKEETSVQDKKQKILEFNMLTTDQKLNLIEFFQKQKANWKFEQIQEASQLPEYFFDDENDLSFMLHQLINSKKSGLYHQSYHKGDEHRSKHKKVQAEELFFVSLLCLNSQQTLRDNVLEFLLKNQDLIVNLIRASMEKAKEKYEQKVENELQLQKQENKAQLGQMNQDIPYQESNYEFSTVVKGKGKSKKIEKQTKKQGKSKKVESSSQEQPILNQKQKEQKLIMCFVNFTIWSYYYIYPQVLKPVQGQTFQKETN